MLKCGLQHEGILRKAGRNSTNAVCDLAVYSIEKKFFQQSAEDNTF